MMKHFPGFFLFIFSYLPANCQIHTDFQPDSIFRFNKVKTRNVFLEGRYFADLNKKETYDEAGHLIESTSYDPASGKIPWYNTNYKYDSLGRINETITKDLTESHHIVINSRTGGKATNFRYCSYEYDSTGLLCRGIISDSTREPLDTIIYDDKGNKQTIKKYSIYGTLSTEIITWYEKPDIVSKSSIRFVYKDGSEKTNTSEYKNIYNEEGQLKKSFDINGIDPRIIKYFYNSSGLLSKIKVIYPEYTYKMIFSYQYRK
ncbi:MAG: hypothetical protein QM737_12190 [Ferruginibacter sp.]